jgi:hypothetical protein
MASISVLADNENKDSAIMSLVWKIVLLLREHTKSAADRGVVLSAVAIAKDLYRESAPTYLDDLETSESLSASQ